MSKRKTQLTSGAAVPDDRSHTADRGDGQQVDYVVLTEDERAQGFVRPVRDAYRHVGIRPSSPTRPLTPEEEARYAGQGYVLWEDHCGGGELGRYWTARELRSGCQQITTMSRAIAETYARDPAFYQGTFCVNCGAHFMVGERGEFAWLDGTKVGT